jgi:hypothetical protein
VNEEYDPTTDTWTARAPFPAEALPAGSSPATSCAVLALSAPDGGVYALAGGSTVWSYDPAADAWQTYFGHGGSFASPDFAGSYAVAAAVSGDRIFRFGRGSVYCGIRCFSIITTTDDGRVVEMAHRSRLPVLLQRSGFGTY